MAKDDFIKDFLDKGNLDYVSFMKCFEHLTLQEKSDFDKKIRKIVDEYNAINETKKCASTGHDFDVWEKRKICTWNGLEDGMTVENHYCVEYYRVCKNCGYEEKSLKEPKEYKEEQIQKEINEHKEAIKKLEKKLGGLNG